MPNETKSYLNIRQIDKSVIDKNVEVNGKDICKYYFIEEAAELTKELTKSMRGKENREELISEIADVYYTLSMLIQEYGVTDEDINACIEYKEKRAKKQLNLE